MNASINFRWGMVPQGSKHQEVKNEDMFTRFHGIHNVTDGQTDDTAQFRAAKNYQLVQ